MTYNLLHGPERLIIETFLQRSTDGENQLTFERLLGYLTGVVLTPGRFLPSEWLQPIMDRGSIVFDDLDQGKLFMDQIMLLYNRLNDRRLKSLDICPFSGGPDLADAGYFQRAVDWTSGLHDVLTMRTEVWGCSAEEAPHVPNELFEEMINAIPFIWAIAEPQEIPEIVSDPVPFQRNLLSTAELWNEEMLKESWDDELIELFRLFCIGRLKLLVDTLQRFSAAYGMGMTGYPFASAIRRGPKVGRNDPCPCNSGKKYKKCCGS
jgi:yecA family protein